MARVWHAMLKAAGLRTWSLIGAMVAMTLFAAWLCFVVWRGPWIEARQPQQLDILGWSLWGALIIIALGFISLTGLGVAASINKGGVSLNVGDDDHPVDQVVVTTETTVSGEKG